MIRWLKSAKGIFTVTVYYVEGNGCTQCNIGVGKAVHKSSGVEEGKK